MHIAGVATMGIVALVSLTQLCPAPWEPIAIVASGVVAGGISGGIGTAVSKDDKRAVLIPRTNLPPGVSQHNMDQCTDQINSQGPVKVYSTGDDSAQADNVPPACMDLASVILANSGKYNDPIPTPMGSASLKYTGLNEDDKNKLQNALSGKSDPGSG